MEKEKVRESGIELLKIISIFLIVISHVSQSLYNMSFFEFGIGNGFLDLNEVTTNFQTLVLVFFRHFGALGNMIFIICSSWFLIGKKKTNKNKIFKLIIDVYAISILFLIIFYSFNAFFNLKWMYIKRSIFPTTYANNWYITCYILFLMLVPFLNIIIENISKEDLLKLNIVLFFIYWVVSFIVTSYFHTLLVTFITIYFFTAYLKLHMENFSKDTKANTKLILFGIMMVIIFIAVTDFVGFHKEEAKYKLLYWTESNNPFLLIIAIGMFNLFKNLNFRNLLINRWSSLTLYIYLIHENILVREYLRLYIWAGIERKFSYSYVVIETLIYALVLFLAATLLSIVYKYTAKRFTNFIANKIYESKSLRSSYMKVKTAILKRD